MSKRPRKRTEIDDIREDTERMLLENKANLVNPNYNERRRICNLIRRNSKLSKALRSLGIRRGEEIADAFFSLNGANFYRYVMWMYYIQQLHPELLPDRGIVFESGDMLGMYLLIRDSYYSMRRMMHQERIQSMNTQGAQNEYLREKLSKMLKSPLRGKAFIEEFSDTDYKGLYLIARMLRSDVNPAEMREYATENLDDIIFEFASNGYTRSMLSFFHMMGLPNRQNGETLAEGTLYANDNLITGIFGFGHDYFNHAATVYQDDLLHKLDLMEHWDYLTGSAEDITEKTKTTDDNTNKPEENIMLEEVENPEVLTSGSLTESSVPAPIMNLATKLSRKHGPVTITSESSGLHIYIADPELLRTDGQKELSSKHLSINADKFFGLGQWDVDLHPTKENRQIYSKYRIRDQEVPCAISMKTHKVYSVKDLLAYVPIQQRHGLFANVKSAVIVGQTNKRLVYDEDGNLVPEWVGHTIPLTELPTNHPAVEYLTTRGYDLRKLEEQFECCYCDVGLPESRAEGRFYSRLPGGMKNCPQGRIIFTVRMNGVRHGYQSRYIDKKVGPLYFFWSHEQKWALIRRELPDGSTHEMFPIDDTFRKGFAPHKYLNAVGSERNKLLMGYDAAVAFNASKPFEKRYCVLVEGPLDAARIGPPAIALLGKSMSVHQAEAIRKSFTHVLTVMDNDPAGQMGKKRIHTMLEHNPVIDIQLPDGTKDIGEMTYEEAEKLIEPYIPR